MPRAKYTRRADGRFSTQITVGRDKNGKLIRKAIYANTSIELERKIRDLTLDGKIIKSGDMLISDYSSSWFETYQSTRRVNTKFMYENIINVHIKPSIGHIPISKLTTSDVQKMINDRIDKPNTCSKIHLVLRQILNQAIEDNLIVRNVANTVKIPKIPKPRKRALTNKEKRAILDADLNPQDRFYINLIYYFGLRREEALGIMRSDFDFRKKILRVDRAIVFDKNTPVLDPRMKSESAHRTIPIPTPILNELKEYVHSCDSLYCLTKQDGNLITHSSFVKMWSRITKAINCCLLSDKEKKLGIVPDRITSHIFRHNYCTTLYYSGISRKKAVQLMGHSNFRMVEEIYAHLDEEKEDAAEKISNAFSSNF